MDVSSLNLARKWRAKTFDEIIGQDLAVKMLKNSLFLGHYFPVYLFTGQKGCGKTSTARVFAMAINCEKLSPFQEHPRQHVIPCSLCVSCKAMLQGKHPDFIEIDAASNTGVDNVRNIIDAAALLPLMGKKRIYLIDEAHMLSKAAFNAFLKLLEEPPATVTFMLATTDVHKIIETVRSRCFQLSFKPVELGPLSEYLRTICASESITFEEQGLVRIVQETGGCVRDALNLLEQVRFSHSCVDEDAVREVLGYLDDTQLMKLYALALQGEMAKLIVLLKELRLERFSADYIWRRLTVLMHAILCVKAGQLPEQFAHHEQDLKSLARAQSWQKLCAMSSLVFEQELIFLKTATPHIFIETILMRIACHDMCVEQPGAGCTGIMNQQDSEPIVQEYGDRDFIVPINKEQPNTMQKSAVVHHEKKDVIFSQAADQWQRFLCAVDQLGDPLLHSVFMQGSCIGHETEKHVVTVEFPEKLIFFKEHIEQTMSLWLPLLRTNFDSLTTLAYRFVGAGQLSAETREEKKKTIVESVSVKQNLSLDIGDAQKWEKTHLLLRYFPGIVREIHES